MSKLGASKKLGLSADPDLYYKLLPELTKKNFPFWKYSTEMDRFYKQQEKRRALEKIELEKESREFYKGLEKTCELLKRCEKVYKRKIPNLEKLEEFVLKEGKKEKKLERTSKVGKKGKKSKKRQ